MTRYRLAMVGALLLVLSEVTSGAPDAPAGATALTAEELTLLLKGNTLSHPIDGSRDRRITFEKEIAYIAWPSMSGKTNSRSGSWNVSGSSFCIVFPQQDKECHAVRRQGAGLTMSFKGQWVPLRKE